MCLIREVRKVILFSLLSTEHREAQQTVSCSLYKVDRDQVEKYCSESEKTYFCVEYVVEKSKHFAALDIQVVNLDSIRKTLISHSEAID